MCIHQLFFYISNACRIVRLRGVRQMFWGSDFSRVERNFTIGQSLKVWGIFQKFGLQFCRSIQKESMSILLRARSVPLSNSGNGHTCFYNRMAELIKISKIIGKIREKCKFFGNFCNFLAGNNFLIMEI